MLIGTAGLLAFRGRLPVMATQMMQALLDMEGLLVVLFKGWFKSNEQSAVARLQADLRKATLRVCELSGPPVWGLSVYPRVACPLSYVK